VSSEMLLGEMVNRIRRIDVQTAADAVVAPRAFVGTVRSSRPSPCHAPLFSRSHHTLLTGSIIGRRQHLSLWSHIPLTPEPPYDAAIQSRRPRASARRHGLRQVSRVPKPGPTGGRADAVCRRRIYPAVLGCGRGVTEESCGRAGHGAGRG